MRFRESSATSLVRVVLVAALLVVPAPLARAAVSPDTVDRAIAKARSYLLKAEKNGSWERPMSGLGEHGDQTTGFTALVTYALLASGTPHQDPKVQSAVDFLKKTPATGVYALGLRCQVWLLLPQTPDVREAMRKDAQILLSSVKREGKGKGFYDYNPSGKQNYSHSRGHYGVLGVWAAAQAGIEVPDSYWQLVEKEWIGDQGPDGGWSYQALKETTHPETPNMTASAVATLFITQEYLHANEGLNCRGNITNPAAEKGIKWLADHFDQIGPEGKLPTGSRLYPYNTFYALERVGVASGNKYIANFDWYQKGADWLLKNQRSDGSWPPEYSELTSTSFAMIFLSRGGAPIAMNKLNYTADDPTKANWNQRPRDAANVARWIGRQNERDLNWQVVNLSAHGDFHDAPILYLSGNLELKLRDEDKAKLKSFVEQGGMLFGNADCGSKAFADSFRKLGSELFAAYEWRELPDKHVIYTAEQFPAAKWKNKPNVLSLSNGVRELMLLIPQNDVAKWWQVQVVGGHEEAFQLMADVFLYSVDKKNLRYRGDTYIVERNTNQKADKNLVMVRLHYPGTWDPEPGGWQRISNILHNRFKLDLEIRTATVGAGTLEGPKLAHMTGAGRFKLDDAGRKELKDFVDRGGMLVVDAAGGAADFATSAETELAAMFPEGLKVLPPEHPLFTAGGLKKPDIAFRDYAKAVFGNAKDIPRLQGIERNGRLIVVYSREDLSAGMVGQAVDGIVGYTPETATELMTRICLYAAGVK